MDLTIRSFIHKRGLQVSTIMYMTHSNRKTTIYLKDGGVIETFHPLKNIIAAFPEHSFKVINKGIAISPAYIADIDKNVYTMRDGKKFAGRVRSMKEHRILKVQYGEENDAPPAGKARSVSGQDWGEYPLLENMPIAFCVIELVFDELGHGVDFIFRYCNKEMERLEGKRLDELMNKSFYEVFKNGDKKWLITYADVALNGATRVIESYSPEIDKNLRIYCFQPKPNFCACALIVM